MSIEKSITGITWQASITLVREFSIYSKEPCSSIIVYPMWFPYLVCNTSVIIIKQQMEQNVVHETLKYPLRILNMTWIQKVFYRNDPKFSDRQAWANSVAPDQSSLLRVCTVCHSICIFWTQLLYMVEPRCLNFSVMILTFRTDRPGQTVQTQIRLLLQEQSDQGLHCLPFYLHRLDSLLHGRAT